MHEKLGKARKLNFFGINNSDEMMQIKIASS